MTTNRPQSQRIRLATLGLAAATTAAMGLFGACGSSGTKAVASTSPSSVSSVAPADSEFCQLEQQIENRFGQAFGSADPSDHQALGLALKSAANDVRDRAARELQLTPSDLHDAAATLIAGLDKAAQGDPSDFETDAYHQASVRIDTYCGLPGVND